VVLMAVQVSVLGLYLPPVFRMPVMLLCPPQTIISLPSQHAKCTLRWSGAFTMLMGVHVSVLGLYLAPSER